MAKTRLDMPHLEPLRYDYRLLHECYSGIQPRKVYTSRLAIGVFMLTFGLLEMLLTMGVI